MKVTQKKAVLIVKMLQLVFYTTSHCHLCEQAEQIFDDLGFKKLISNKDISLEIVDIAGDDSLEELYGVRIPVLKRLDNDVDIGWPFTHFTLQNFLNLN